MNYPFVNSAQERKDFEQSRKDFTRLLQNKQGYYESTVNSIKLSSKAVAARNMEIKTLVTFHNNMLKLIEALDGEIEVLEQSLLKTKNYTRCLEAVCLIHGVNDFPCYTVQGFEALLFHVKDLYAENQVQIPNRLKKAFGISPSDLFRTFSRGGKKR